MENGVSIYLGGEQNWQVAEDFLNNCHTHGIRRFFTSLQIPEADTDVLKNDFMKLTHWCRIHGADLICDVSPLTLKMLDLDSFEAEKFKALGITTLRLDDGFSGEEIAELIGRGHGIQLNASTCNELLLEKLSALGVDLSRLEALHNYYPKKFTGLNEDYFYKINRSLKRYGVKTAAFIPDYNCTRGPMHEGLPTLEKHRYREPLFTYQHLKVLGTDNVFVGDPLPAENTLEILAKDEFPVICIPVKPAGREAVWEKISGRELSIRAEVNDYTWRTVEGRQIFKDTDIPAEAGFTAQPGDVLINNAEALRYKGEVEIAKVMQDFGAGYNYLGKIEENYLNLLAKLSGQIKIKFFII